ncbi:MAG TPA: RNHCP domain-containing protein [Candidatus Gracilibacteria bacterium]
MSSTFIHKNEKFTCQHCGTKNPPAKGTCRDHCVQCLYSVHVDENPGDRMSLCNGLMEPKSIDLKGDGTMGKIVYECTKCQKKYRNKIAEDDDKQALFRVYQKNTL